LLGRRDGILHHFGWRVWVFGNGTGVVWRFDCSQHDEGAPIGEVEASLIAVQQEKRRRGCHEVEGDDHAVEGVAAGWEGDVVVEHAGFDGPEVVDRPALLKRGPLAFDDGTVLSDDIMWFTDTKLVQREWVIR
jgi:hypothetical protein